MNRAVVAEIESQFANEKRLGDLKLCFVDVSPKKDYDFAEFFYHVRQGILKYHSGVGDIIHSVIMKNNGIKAILTFDEKDDFKQIPDLTVIHPKDIKRKRKHKSNELLLSKTNHKISNHAYPIKFVFGDSNMFCFFC